MREGFPKLTVDDVKRIKAEKKEEMKRNRTSPDLREYLNSFPWELRVGGRDIYGPENPTVMFNMSFFVGSKYDMLHQGDINVEMIKGMCERIENLEGEKVYIFSEHIPYKPVLGPFDGTVLRFDKGMARPFGNEDIPLYAADIILERDGIAILNYEYSKPEFLGKYFERTGWKVEYKIVERPTSGFRAFYF